MSTRAAFEPGNNVLRSLAIAQLASWSAPVRSVLIAERLDRYQAVLTALLPAPVASVLVPLAVVDESSLACVVTSTISDGERTLTSGAIVRVFLTGVAPRHQLALLDIDPVLYLQSLEEELAARPLGLRRVLDEIGPAYEQAYIDKEKRPRDFVVRPVRLACQNVIVGLAAIAHDSTFDGLSVPAWQTCEVPHVATHEANRALAALTLCDAFSRGGTMEIRFDRPARVVAGSDTYAYSGHPEDQVPASLRRFGRTVGVALGGDDPAAITPAEARELFLAVTPMPTGLRSRIQHAAVSPERACYTLLSRVWREIELDVLLATSDRALSILAGGADWTDRCARQSESDATRAALMAGMLFRRLNESDTAGAANGVRVVEDISAGVTWTVDDVAATVAYHLPAAAAPPWSDLPASATLRVAPRVHVTDQDIAQLRERHVALLLPYDVDAPPSAHDLPVLRCPDRLAEMDRTIEEKLLTSRISRA